MKTFCTLILLVVSTCAFTQMNVKDVQGRKQGPWQKKYENSVAIEYKGQFKDDKPVGTFTYYYKSGNLKGTVVHDEKTGRSVAVFYHDNASKLVFAKGIYRNQLKDSVWDYFGPSGRQSLKETYLKDKLNGMTTVYYVPEEVDNRKLMVAKTSMYKNGVLDGDMIEYFESGTVKSKVKYVNGVKEGVSVINHPAGNPMVKENYIHGVLHGWQYAYDITGKEIGKKYYLKGEILEGKRLEDRLKYCKDNGIDPNKN